MSVPDSLSGISSGNVVPIWVESPGNIIAQPVSIGVPFPLSGLRSTRQLKLIDSDGNVVPIQHRPLAHWPDGSVRWLLLDFIARNLIPGKRQWQLTCGDIASADPTGECGFADSENQLVLKAASGSVLIGRRLGQPLLQVIHGGREFLDPSATRITVTDAKGDIQEPTILNAEWEALGPIRATARIDAEVQGQVPCRLFARVSVYPATGLIHLQVTIQNPRRARHRGGLWDLGDKGSIYLADFSVSIGLAESTSKQVRFSEEPGRPFRETPTNHFEIYQESSGGENWRSTNHVNRFDTVPCSFRGYRLRTSKGHETGLRANPVVRIANQHAAITVALPEFWQQFPKAIDFPEGALRLRLFPSQFADLHELQGGEQKTHSIWLAIGAADQAESVLDWVHQPADIRPAPDWFATAKAFSDMVLSESQQSSKLDEYLRPIIDGPDSMIARRDVIDEYGWRNYGDVYADHENAHFTGAKPVISHLNNQFDFLYGSLLQYARTGDRRWRDVFDPLARHVIDIDIYHTDQDRAAYCNGLFWMTDHYLDASTSNHRTYSRTNKRPGQPYGGGPGSSHNFTSGLLYYHYLTGDARAAEAVVGLADWVINMDDGRRNILSVLDEGPTGLASYTTTDDYHGPGRGAGLSINSQLDAWILTGRRTFLEKAEQLIRRCVHPLDDIDSHDLLNAELRWSYPVFFVVLARYLRKKAEIGELDEAYAYGRASLLHYAGWMLANERPFLDQRDRLEFPTETWAAQEFRKANTLRLAAEHAQEPLRADLLKRADELSDRAWQDLISFATSRTSRAIAIMLTEGTTDDYFRNSAAGTLPESAHRSIVFGQPVRFVSQKQNAIKVLRTPWKIPARILRAVVHYLSSGDTPGR